MAAVDSFALLYREIARSCSCYVETLALVGALYTVSKAVTLLHDCYSLIRQHIVPRLVHPGDLLHQYGQWAIVSGAPDAVAEAYAEELARHGVSIILISSDARVARETAPIPDIYGVQVVVLQADFGQGAEACSRIRDAIGSKEIGFVVNCLDSSGDISASFHGTPESELWNVINESVCAASAIIRLALPGMAKRRRGAVVNISSGRFCSPRTGGAALAACTAFFDHFSRALHYEYGHLGIFVQSLIPLKVASQDLKTRGLTSWVVPAPHVYARHALSTLGVSHRTTGYWPHTLQLQLMQCIPEWLWLFGSRAMCMMSRSAFTVM